MRPVMNDARPAVQLAWPYQLVNTAPSLAIRSTFGVGWPSTDPPSEYAPKSFQPVSSVMSMTTFGLACARACPMGTIRPNMTSQALRIFNVLQGVGSVPITRLAQWLAVLACTVGRIQSEPVGQCLTRDAAMDDEKASPNRTAQSNHLHRGLDELRSANRLSLSRRPPTEQPTHSMGLDFALSDDRYTGRVRRNLGDGAIAITTLFLSCAS